METIQATASQSFASFFAKLTLADVSAAAQHRVKLHILDTLGAGIAGSASIEADISRTALGPAHGEAPAGGGAPLWGTPKSVPPLQAAFINGVAAHAFELDDSGGCDHSGAVALPAALAASALATAPVSGERLMLAVTAGYELGRRVQTALGGYDRVNNAGWHSTGVCGTFAAAIAAGIILDLDQQQLTSAIGLAGSFTGGTWAFMSDGSMSKRLHVGRAAEAGLNSAVLARAGFTGPSDIFSAPWGSFLSLYGGNVADEAELYAGLGDKWLVERASIKPYASCRSTHSAIDALLDVKQEQGLDPASIERITVHTSSLILDMCGGRDTSSLVAAQLSMPFALATAMLRNGVGLRDIALEGRREPAIATLMERIHLEVDASQHGGSAEPHLEIVANGRTYRRQAVAARGAMTNRLSDDETLAKFSELAGTRLATDTAGLLAHKIMTLEACPDIRQIHGLVLTNEEPLPIR
jgi:2-methylcitrate dehydratase PrpD